MKSKMKRQGTTKLPRFVVGALATAGASAANGATVQISFANNLVNSSTGLNSGWTSDLTGDNNNDLRLVENFASGRVGVYSVAGSRGMYIAGSSPTIMVGNQSSPASEIRRDLPFSDLVAFTFQDTNINGGDLTDGWLHVEAVWDGGIEVTELQIIRLIFDDASTTAPTGLTRTSTGIATYGVPEPSSLGLLALGAGGLMMRRRRAA